MIFSNNQPFYTLTDDIGTAVKMTDLIFVIYRAADTSNVLSFIVWRSDESQLRIIPPK